MEEEVSRGYFGRSVKGSSAGLMRKPKMAGEFRRRIDSDCQQEFTAARNFSKSSKSYLPLRAFRAGIG